MESVARRQDRLEHRIICEPAQCLHSLNDPIEIIAMPDKIRLQPQPLLIIQSVNIHQRRVDRSAGKPQRGPR